MATYRIVGRVMHSHYNARGGTWLIAGPDNKRAGYARSYTEAQRLVGSLRGRAARAAKKLAKR